MGPISRLIRLLIYTSFGCASFAIYWLCPAFAYQDQATLGMAAGYTYRIAEHSPNHGFSAEINGSIGLNDIWSLRGFVSYSIHPARDELHAFCTGVELVYLVDVLEIVPFFGAGVDGMADFWKEKSTFDIGAHGVAGFDYLLSRVLTLGFQVKPFLVLSALDFHPAHVSATVTTSFMFDL